MNRTKLKAALAHRIPWASLSPLLVAASYFFVVGTYNRLRFSYELDRDEGFSLMKALLVSRGYSLYGEIWNDQPPGYTFLIALFPRIFGPEPETARLLTILIIALLMAAIYDLVRRQVAGFHGIIGGLIACAALILTYHFVTFSSGLLVGLPAIAFAVYSWHAIEAYGRTHRRLLVAGGLFGIGLTIKLFILPLGPILAGAIVADSWFKERNLRRGAIRALWYAAGSGLLILAAFAPFLGEAGFSSLYSAHASARASTHSEYSLTSWMVDDAWIWPLALLGLGATWTRRLHVGFTATAWFIAMALILRFHRPLWSHHRYLLLVPACVLVGIGVGSALLLVQRRRTPKNQWTNVILGASTFLLSAWLFPTSRFQAIARSFRHPLKNPSPMLAVEAAVRAHAPNARVIVASRQMYAYRLGLEVPPALAVTSRKRVDARQMSQKMVRQTIRNANPDALIIDQHWTKPIRLSLQGLLNDYRVVYHDPKNADVRVFVPKE